MNRDSIIINDLELFAFHGVNSEEKERGQRFLICVDMTVDVSEAARTDDLEKTVSYSAVIKLIRSLFTAESYDLIETAAEKIALAVLENYSRVAEIAVTVKKPEAPMKAVFDYVAVTVRRSR